MIHHPFSAKFAGPICRIFPWDKMGMAFAGVVSLFPFIYQVVIFYPHLAQGLLSLNAMAISQQIETRSMSGKSGAASEGPMKFEGSMNYEYDEIMAASQSHLIVMLYREALVALKASVVAIERGNIEARWRASAKATNILAHLYLTLDLNRGGDIANNLGRIYQYILRRLPDVNLKNDPKPAQEGACLIEPLLNSWEDLDIRISHLSECDFSNDLN